MKKVFFALAVSVAVLAACGGGGGGNPSTGAAVTQSLKVSLYGNPLVSSAQSASAKALVSMSAAEAQPASSSPATASDAAATVQTLTDALTARGVPATVTPQVMDGTTLHQIVMGENNGLPPTPDQFKTDPSEWIVVNFQLDDMVTPTADPAQQVAITQFIQDLAVFVQRAAVSGKRVFAVQPFQTCDVPNFGGAAYGLSYALTQASLKSNLWLTGAVGPSVGYDGTGQLIPNPELAHLGADCRTPDAYLLDKRTQAIADDIANRYKASISGSKY